MNSSVKGIGDVIYIVKEHADQLEVPLGSISEHNAVPLLAHEQQHGNAEVSIHQSLSQSLGGFLGVTDLVEVSTLHREIHTQYNFPPPIHNYCSYKISRLCL